ncbi:diaminopimelate decarboxylase [Thermoanaerobacterium thermosaccharolyticum]|uniref:Diaminopimelate decarboxylase n=2 Tax=Thermoanaerobacterium thermosaccharolyticum TaxID=1517 RepID=L0IHK9_THETR|nr:diaminopimelate decarboxylase [Thermoanaerobacterium thermosaccharolyticum M0795]PHO07081.1 diaminopimelate decarboxylase [Thermoanaerobacterium thermosaccharolyticum]
MFQKNMRINSKGHLEIAGCDTVKIAKQYGTPLYVIDEEQLRENCRSFYNGFKRNYPGNEVIYASKAFMTTAICKIIEEENLGLDVVSGGELYTALKADFPVKNIYFHGNNKSADELTMALEYNIGCIIVDNWFELNMLNELAFKMGKKPNIYLRVSPGVEAHTHEYIKTGQIDSKFGFPLFNGDALDAIKYALTLDNVNLTGLHCHIGSQIFSYDSYKAEIDIMMNFLKKVKDHTGWEVGELDLGGGFGIAYVEEDDPQPIELIASEIMKSVEEYSRNLNIKMPHIIVEPGRSIIGNAGTTLYTVGAIKNIPGVRKYVSVDGGMADNIRTALYGAKYNAIVANKARKINLEKVSIAGKCCESGDMLIWDIELPQLESGDIIAVTCTGAYNYSMASNYNRLPRPAAVLVNNGESDLIVARETYEDLVRNDVIPQRLLNENKKIINY